MFSVHVTLNVLKRHVIYAPLDCRHLSDMLNPITYSTLCVCCLKYFESCISLRRLFALFSVLVPYVMEKYGFCSLNSKFECNSTDMKRLEEGTHRGSRGSLRSSWSQQTAGPLGNKRGNEIENDITPSKGLLNY